MLPETFVGGAGVYHCFSSGKWESHLNTPPHISSRTLSDQEIILMSHAKPVTPKQEVKELYTAKKTCQEEKQKKKKHPKILAL